MTVRGFMPLLWGAIRAALLVPQQEQPEQQEQQQRFPGGAVHAYRLSLPEIDGGATFRLEVCKDKRRDRFQAAPDWSGRAYNNRPISWR